MSKFAVAEPGTHTGVISPDSSLGFGDLPFARPNAKTEFEEKYPTAAGHLDHFVQRDATNAALKNELAAQQSANVEAMHDQKVQMENIKESYRQHGHALEKTTTDPNDPTKKIKGPSPIAPHQKKFTALRVANEKIHDQMKNLPRPVSQMLLEKATLSRVVYEELQWQDFLNGPKDECETALDAIQKTYSDAVRANRTTEEAKEFATRWYNNAKERGEPNVSSLIIGGKITREGGEVKVALEAERPRVALPVRTMTFDVMEGNQQVGAQSVTTEIEDAIDFMVWCDDDEKILKKMHDTIERQNKGKKQISVAEKREIKAKLDVEMLLARRHLEAACRQAEAEGKPVLRRPDTPFEVYLWLQRAPVLPKKSDAEEDFGEDIAAA